MARPTNADSSKTYERILEAAISIVTTHGMEALTVRRTAEVAGVGLGTLRYYFATQEALLEGCLDSYHDGLADMQRDLSSRLGAAPNPQAAIGTCVDAIFDFLENNSELVRMRIIMTVQKGGLSESRHTHFRGPFLDGVGQVLQAVSGGSTRDMRLVADAANRLISSYATCSDQEACDVTGEADPTLARAKLREFASEVCCHLVFG